MTKPAAHLQFEADYWGDCCNTFDEEQKHYVYAAHMEIRRVGWSFDLEGKSVLDIGSGPVSMLLKTRNRTPGCAVVDPLMDQYPQWVLDRYHTAGIVPYSNRGEDLIRLHLPAQDEVWIYNCLQHVEDPKKVITNALAIGRRLRIFEWINIPPHEGHPHMLTEAALNAWIGKPGRVVHLTGESGCSGLAYANVT